MAPINGHIDKRDFDANRPLLGDSSQGRRLSDLDDDGLMDDVVDGIIERDRQKMKLMITRYFSFFCAILSWSVALLFLIPACTDKSRSSVYVQVASQHTPFTAVFS